jgi:NAD(P)H-flavin reductase
LVVKDKKLEEVLTSLGATPDDKLQISVTGKGSHIFHILKKEKKVDL